MIAAVCLNPAVDRTVSVSCLIPGGLNRVTASRTDAGGKGVNVAVTLARLGEDAALCALLPKENGGLIEEKAAKENVALYPIPQDGAVRVNLKILDESKHEITEINECGPAVTAGQADAIRKTVSDLAGRCDLMIFSGSLPPGCSPSLYRELMDIADERDCRCILDADGVRLREGLESRPLLIKPNRHELEELTGTQLPSLADVDKAARRLASSRARYVAVSLGGEGAYITDGAESLYAPALPVVPGSTVGAGDAMIAGFAAGLRRGYALEEMFRLGVACATASVMSEGTGLIMKETADALLGRVVIKKELTDI